MSEKPIEVSSNRSISMPIFNLLGIIGLVASAVFTFNTLTNKSQRSHANVYGRFEQSDSYAFLRFCFLYCRHQKF